MLAGDRALIKDITKSIIGLKFSRTHETEADKASVTYLCPTDYVAAGGAKFFEKIEAEGGAGVPEWLSTHPSPDNRIEYFYNQSTRSEEHTSELQSRPHLVCRLLLEKKKADT